MHLSRLFIVASLFAAACTEPTELGQDEAALVPGWQLVTGQTAASTAVRQQLDVACPSGTRAFGAGWAVLDPTNAILSGEAVRFEPILGGKQWRTAAVNRSGFSPSWSLKVWVFCATPDPTYQIVRLEQRTPTSALEQPCPVGMPSGAGYAGLDSRGRNVDLAVTTFEPVNAEHWRLETNGATGAALSVICHDPFYLPGYEQWSTTVTGQPGFADLSTPCPAGKVSLGAGWRLRTSTGGLLDGRATTFQPSWNGTTWMTRTDVAAASYELTTTAVCVDP